MPEKKETVIRAKHQRDETIPRKLAAAMVCKEINKQQLLAIATILGPMFVYGAGIVSYGTALLFVGAAILIGAFFAIRARYELKRLNEKYGV